MLAVRTKSTWKENWAWIVVAALVALLAVAMVCRTAGAPQSPSPLRRTADIVSPWAGEFCAGEYTGGPSYVGVGTRVDPSTIVGRIETVNAGSVDTQFLLVAAGMSGTISEVLVQDQQMVSPGQPLFKVQLAEPTPTIN